MECENRISEQNTESDDNMHQFANSNLRAKEATSNENGMDSDENAADDHNVKDNEEHASSTHSDNDENTFPDVDIHLEKMIDFDEYEMQDVSSLRSSDLDIESDADEHTMEKLAAKLSKSSVEKEKPVKIKEKEECKHLKEKYLLVLQDSVQDKNEKVPNIHPEQKKSTGIKNIKKTKFYKKRQEASSGRTLSKYYYGSTDIRKAMALMK